MMWECNLASKEAVKEGLEKVKAKFGDVVVKNAFKDFNKTVQFICPDIDLSYVIKVTDGEIEVFKEGTAKKPDISIYMESDTFLSIQNKEITSSKAVAQGKVKFTGIVADLLLIEKHLI
jgi:alkyl sulfatase BDS1-like metallo-beta-lactamase superfamily hydrolase